MSGHCARTLPYHQMAGNDTRERLGVLLPQLPEQLSHSRGGHALHIYPVGGQRRLGERGKAVIVIPAHGHILRHPDALLPQLLDQMEGHLVAVAYKGPGQFLRQPDGNEPPVPVPVRKQPLLFGDDSRPPQGALIAQIPLHNAGGGQNGPHIADFRVSPVQQMPGQGIPAVHIVAEDTVQCLARNVAIQQNARNRALPQRHNIRHRQIPHHHQAVHLPARRQGRQTGLHLRLLGDDLDHTRQPLFAALDHQGAVQAGIKGVFIKKAVRHQHADITGPGGFRPHPAALIAHLPGQGHNPGPHFLADARFSRQRLGDRHHADIQLFRDIRHPNRFPHGTPSIYRTSID